MVRDLEVGDRVPPERELAQTLGASTLMIGRVLQELQREGFVRRIPGKGTFYWAKLCLKRRPKHSHAPR